MWILAGIFGAAADFLINRNILSTVNVRRIFNSIGHYGSAFGLIGLAFTGCDKTAAIIWLCIAVGLNGATYSGYQVHKISNFFIELGMRKADLITENEKGFSKITMK